MRTMCINFAATHNEAWVRKQLGSIAEWPQAPYPQETYPGQLAPIARRAPQRSADGPTICTLARFGLIPHWAQDAKSATQIARKTYNARTETVAGKPSYRTAWRKRQFAIALLDDFFEPNWDTGQAVRWRIRRADGQPMGVASIWDRWVEPATGEIVHSFSMLTVNADGHPVMGRFHRPGDEKRSVVVLEPDQFGAWIGANAADTSRFLRKPADGLLVAVTAASVERDVQAALF